MPTGSLASWSAEHAASLGFAALGTALALALTVIAAPWLVARLPPDHFARPAPDVRAEGPLALALLIARNALALATVLLGLLVLVVPGPGLVSVVIGLSLARFPGRHALVARLAGSPHVFASLNWLRRRRGRPPFVHPASGARAGRDASRPAPDRDDG